jgi:hypothetical protein
MYSANAVSDAWDRIPLEVRDWITRNATTGTKIILVVLFATFFSRFTGRFLKK